MDHRIARLRRGLLQFASFSIVVSMLAAGAFAAAVVTVSQQNRSFTTRNTQVARGDTIHVTNDDEFTHQVFVDAPTMTFESDEQSPGDSVNIRFPTAGTFDVHCHIHPKMVLTVVVR